MHALQTASGCSTSLDVFKHSFYSAFYYSAPYSGVEYCDVYACLCLCVCPLAYPLNYSLIFTKFCLHVIGVAKIFDWGVL